MADTRTDAAYDVAIDYARNLGAEQGRNAAGWYLQDALARTTYSGGRLIAEKVLRGIADGDPAILDTFPAPDLSGEWTDTLTGPMLEMDALDAAGVRDGDGLAEDMEWFNDICDAYESAFSDAVADAIETAARAVLA